MKETKYPAGDGPESNELDGFISKPNSKQAHLLPTAAFAACSFATIHSARSGALRLERRSRMARATAG